MSINKVYLGSDEIYQRINQNSTASDFNALITENETPTDTYINWDKYNKYDYSLTYNGETYPTEIEPRLELVEENSEDARDKLVCVTNGLPYTCYSGYSAVVKENVKSYEPVTYSTSQLKNLNYMFKDQSNVIKVLNFPSTVTTTNMSSMFSSCSNLTSLNLSSFDTSNVTNMNNMFYKCSNLISIDLSSFDTSNVTNMNNMFNSCSGLTELDLSSFDTSNVTDMRSMFISCSSLTELNLGNSFDTSNVTDMSSMFSGVKVNSFDLSNFNTSNVTNMSSMFNWANTHTFLDLSSFDTSNVTNMSSMFSNCSSLTELNLGNSFDTSNVTNMGSMFYTCYKLTTINGTISNIKVNLDLSPTKITTASNFFNGLVEVTSKKTLRLPSTCYYSSDEIALATSKGWTVTGGNLSE